MTSVFKWLVDFTNWVAAQDKHTDIARKTQASSDHISAQPNNIIFWLLIQQTKEKLIQTEWHCSLLLIVRTWRYNYERWEYEQMFNLQCSVLTVAQASIISLCFQLSTRESTDMVVLKVKQPHVVNFFIGFLSFSLQCNTESSYAFVDKLAAMRDLINGTIKAAQLDR